MAKALAGASAVATRPLYGSALQIHTVEDLARVADIMFKGGITPPGMSNPATLAAVILAGLEVGLCPTQAVGSIMLTNGRLSIYGDAALALVRASGLLASISEELSGEGDSRKCVCKVTRKGEAERAFSFSMGEAKQAGLIDRAKGKDGKGSGPWVSYPDRMLTFRSRGYALRDVFPDVLRGLAMQEVEADEAAPPRVAQVSQAAEENEVRQLPAAAGNIATVTEAASTSLAPASLAAASPAAADPSTLPITDEQKNEVKFLKERFVTAIGESDAEVIRTRWVELLGEYGVDSALKFTAAQAAKFIDEVGKKYDPFGHPSATLKT